MSDYEKAEVIGTALRDAYELGYSAGVRDQRTRRADAYNPSSVWALVQNLVHKLLG